VVAVRVPDQSEPGEAWEVKAARVHLRRDTRPTAGEYRLIAARSRRTEELKYFASSAGPGVPLTRVVRAAFARWNVEHAFRVAKGEAGLSHYEGRSYAGLMRHLVLCLVVVGFVALRAAGLRGTNPEVTAERVCRALDARCAEVLARGRGGRRVARTAEVIGHHQRRNRAARESKCRCD
jgi:hypothetical protein